VECDQADVINGKKEKCWLSAYCQALIGTYSLTTISAAVYRQIQVNKSSTATKTTYGHSNGVEKATSESL